MNILIYTGNHHTTFSMSGWQDHGGNAITNSTILLAETLARNGHLVTVSGEVTNETIDNISFCATDKLASNTHYDVVIAISYIHYINELESRDITYDKSLFWVHYDHHFIWWRGEKLDNDGEEFLRDPRLTWVIALSETQARAYARNNPYASRKIRIIGNALHAADWATNEQLKKQKNKFISCSSPDRGLDTLLAIWPKIKQQLPDASLAVATPYSGTDKDSESRPSIDGVSFLGCQSVKSLYKEIQSAEYWINPNRNTEDYGLTALEMMMGGVKIISTATGNHQSILADNAAPRAAIIDESTGDFEQATLQTFLDYHADPQTAQKHLANAHEFARQQSWDNVYSQWMEAIDSVPGPTRKHPELFSYFDDKDAWIERFVTYAARTREWDLIVDEPFDNCFTMPLFTPEFCQLIRDEAEHSESWTTDRHAHYPTTDMLLQVLDMEDIYRDLLDTFVMPMARSLWALTPAWKNFHAETFLAKYTATAQGHLSIHHDESDITCLIQLSDLDEYEGGGTFFKRQKKLVKNGIGYATLHPGHITHMHGGRAISKGLRYILVSFISRNR